VKTVLVFKSVNDVSDRQEKGDKSCQLEKGSALNKEEQHWGGG